jgi:regulatory protein
MQDEAKASRNSRRNGPRPARPITASYLMNAAQYHLQRFSSTRANLKRVLTRKAKLRGQDEGFTAETPGLIEATLDRLEELKLLDDRAFAIGRAATLKRKGASGGAARMALAAKGVPRDVASEALAKAELSEGEQAFVTARRLKLGPWRRVDAAPEFDDRERAKLQRRGFSSAAMREALQRFHDEE